MYASIGNVMYSCTELLQIPNASKFQQVQTSKCTKQEENWFRTKWIWPWSSDARCQKQMGEHHTENSNKINKCDLDMIVASTYGYDELEYGIWGLFHNNFISKLFRHKSL